MRRSATALHSISARPRILLTGVATASLAVLFVLATAIAATTTEDVMPSSMNGWFGYNDTTDTVDNSLVTFVNGPGTAPLGNGSARLNAASGERKLLAKSTLNGLPLGGVTTLKYSTYRASVDAGNNLALSLQIGWDDDTTDGNTGFRGRLVFEPYFGAPGGVPQNTWQEWNTLSATTGWWTTLSGATACTQSVPCSWTQVKVNYPNAVIHSNPALGFIGIRAGTAAIDGNVDKLVLGTFSDTFTYSFEPDTACTTVCYVDDSGNDNYGGTSASFPKKTIQAALDTVSPGGQVHVLPGSYTETALNRNLAHDADANATYNFGLYFGKTGVKLMGVTAGDAAITDPNGTLANVTTVGDANFGPDGLMVDADNVTVQGLTINGNLDPNSMTASNNKTIEVIADNFKLQYSKTNVPDGGGSVYINDFSVSGNVVKAYHVLNNEFSDGTSVDIASGAGSTGPLSGREIKNNHFNLNDNGFNGVSFNGSGTTVPWFMNTVGGAQISGNDFENSSQYIRSRGTVVDSEFDWDGWFAGNTFEGAVMVGPDPQTGDLRGTTTVCGGSFSCPDTKRIGATVQGEVDRGSDGDTVWVKADTYDEQVVVDDDLYILGQGEGTTTIKAPASLVAGSDPGRFAVVDVKSGADVEMSDLTVSGPGPSGCGSLHYGILVTGAAHLNAHDLTVADIRDNPLSGCQNGNGIQVGRQAISQTGTADIDNVTVTGYQKTGLLVDNTGSWMNVTDSTVTGAGATPLIAQNGIQISRGATGSVTGTAVSGNECNHASCGTDALGSTSAGVLLFDSGAGTEISGNTISGNDSGLYYFGGAATIEENSFSSNRYVGLYLDQGDATVTANTFTGGQASIVSASFTGNTADSAATLSNNVMSGASDAAVIVSDDDTGDSFMPAPVAHDNSITSSGNLVDSDAPNVVDFSANWWGTNVESTIVSKMIGNVDFTPFLDSNSDTGNPGFHGSLDTLHVTASGGQSGSTGRIQEGINLVTNTTLLVGPGTFSEHVNVNKTLNLLGANSGVDARGARGTESIIDGGLTDATLQISADNVKVDGFKIKGGGNGLNAGVYAGIGSASGYQLLNNVITDNAIGAYANCDGTCLIKHNLFDGNNQPTGGSGGAGIYVEGTTALTVEENEFKNHTVNNPVIFASTASGAHTNLVFKSNSLHNNSYGVYVISVHGGNFEANTISASSGTSLAFAGDDTNITVTKNVLNSGFRGTRVQDDGYGLGANSAISVNRNSIVGNNDGVGGNYDGLLVSDYTGNLDGTCNWWGDASGPSGVGSGSGDSVSAGVTYSPWLVSSDLDGACAGIAVVSDQGDITINEGQTFVGSGSFDRTDATITISPAITGFTDNGNGTWSLSHPTTDDFGPTLYTVTATVAGGGMATDTFTLKANNVNPTATFNAPTSQLYSTGFNISLTSPSDAGSSDTFTYAFDCGSGYNSFSATTSRACTAPSTPGTITVKGTIKDDNGGLNEYTQTVTITQQDITVDNASGHDFGNQAVSAGPTAPFTFTVTNDGDADLTINGVSKFGTDAGQFFIVNDNCTAEVLIPDEQCTVGVTFDPSSTGAKTATFRVTSNDPDEVTVDRALSGTGTTGSPTNGNITIVLNAQPDSAQDFAFTGDLGPFTLDEDADGTNSNSKTVSLAPGTYQVTQSAVTGWSLTGLSCNTGETTDINNRKVTINLASSENVICTFTDSLRRPDALISLKQNKKFGGNNLYSSTAVKNQTRTRAVAANGTGKIWIRVQNDGFVSDSFTVDANITGSSSYTVQFFSGATNITAAVVAGTYQTSSLNQGAFTLIEMRITAAANTAANATATADVFVSSTNAPTQLDMVRGKIKRA